MSGRGSAGLRHVLAALSGIQRTAATGRLATRAPGGGALVFRGGLLVGVIRADAPAPAADSPPVPTDLRGEARGILRIAAISGEKPVFASENPDAAAAGAGESAPLNAADLILDLVAAAADPEWVRSQVASTIGPVHPNTAAPAILPRLSLTPSAGFILSRADGGATLDEILAVSPLSEDQTLKTLFALVAAGMLVAPGLEVLPETTVMPAAPPGGAPRPAAAAGPGAGKAPKKKVSDLDAFLTKTSTGKMKAVAPPAGAAGPTTPPASPAAAKGPAPEEERQRVVDRIAACRDADHYAVLGIQRGADEEHVRRAYYKLAKVFHPDRYRSADYEDIFLDIEKMFAATTEAYNVLTDGKLRGDYERHLSEIAGGQKPAETDAMSMARERYVRGRKALDAGEFFDALSLLEGACRMDPGKFEHWFYLGIVQTKNPRWRKKAEESLLKAIELNPGQPQTYLQLARLYKSGGLARRAAEMYERVLPWDPGNAEALEALGRRKPEKAAKPAGIKSLFKGSKS